MHACHASDRTSTVDISKYGSMIFQVDERHGEGRISCSKSESQQGHVAKTILTGSTPLIVKRAPGSQTDFDRSEAEK